MEPKRANKVKISVVLVTTLFLLAGIFAYNQVNNSITEEDIIYINKFLDAGDIASISPEASYEDEIKYIIRVQKTVLKVAPLDITFAGISFNQSREPKDLYLKKSGLCSDRSRVIEKILRRSGFQTRHISFYSTKETASKFKSLITPQIASHAVSEVLTQKGWLVIDSNDPWISLDKQALPVSIKKIQSDTEIRNIEWHPKYLRHMDNMYKNPFVVVYGLYSRHGRFYPPFNFIPDIHWPEFSYNVL
ncbi:MAG: hypothetical protein HOJ79_13965 [Nitrospina sp.]|nr:hypothetical protein [Nitrospina sp.]